MPGQPSLGLPELFFARDLPGFGKSCPAWFALGDGRSQIMAWQPQFWAGSTRGSFGVQRLKINRSAFLGSVATRIVLWGSPGLWLPAGGPIVVGCEKDGGWGG